MEKERAKWKIYWEPRGRMAGFGEGNEKRRTIADKVFSNSELAREKMWSRIHLIPVLQAEEDRDLVRRHWAEKAREKELLGAETKVYNNDKYVSNSIITFQGVTLANGERADLSALHTPSRPRTPPSKEVEHTKGIWGGREEETHVVYIYIAGFRGVFSNTGNHRPVTVSNVHSKMSLPRREGCHTAIPCREHVQHEELSCSTCNLEIFTKISACYSPNSSP